MNDGYFHRWYLKQSRRAETAVILVAVSCIITIIVIFNNKSLEIGLNYYYYYDGCNTEDIKIGNNDGKCKTSSLMLIPPLQSPHQGGSNGGQIIKICFLSILIVNNESFVSIAT
jgi:hypothetical protein